MTVSPTATLRGLLDNHQQRPCSEVSVATIPMDNP